MKTKTCAILAGSFLFFICDIYPQNIPVGYWGMNGWMPPAQGENNTTHVSPGNNATINVTSNPGGNFDDIALNTSVISSAPIRFIRFGGTTADINIPDYSQYDAFVDECLALGATPAIQVSFLATKLSSYTSVGASYYSGYGTTDIVNLMSHLESRGTPVYYWILGNEPDLYHTFPGVSATKYTASDISANYFKSYALALKKHAYNHVPSYSIKIIGPELADFDPAEPVSNTIMRDLLTTSNTGNNFSSPNITGFIKDEDGTYPNSTDHYLDIVSFHLYPFSQGGIAPTPSGVINVPSGFFQTQLTQLQTYLSHANNKNPNLKVALTECNLNSSNPTNTALDNTSFVAGQFIASMFANGLKNNVSYMVPWSMAEGTGSGDHGFVTNNPGNYVARSTYWHETLMANYFKSGAGFTNVLFEGIDKDGGNNDVADFVCFGANVSGQKQSVVVLMNYGNANTKYDYNIMLNGTGTGSGLNTPVKITFAMGSTLSSFSHAGSINPQETHFIIFDCNGAWEGTWVYNASDASNGNAPTYNSGGTSPIPSVGLNCLNNCSNPQQGQQVEIQLTGAQYYNWMYSKGVEIVNPSANGDDVKLTCNNPNFQGVDTYTFIATGSNGCITTQNVDIVNSGAPIGNGSGLYAYICAGSPAACGQNNGQATVCAGGCGPSPMAYQYHWDNGETTQVATQLSPGPHAVSVNCTGYPSMKVLHVDIQNVGNPPTVYAGANQTVNRNCRVTLTASPNLQSYGYTYKWFKGNSTVPFSTNFTTSFAPFNTSTYRVEVTSPAGQGGCTNSSTTTVFVNTRQYCPVRPDITPVTSRCPVNTSITITPYVLQGDTVIVDSTNINGFIVPAGVTLTIQNAVIGFVAGAGIEVQQGEDGLPQGRLIIINSTLAGCNGQHWAGIRANGIGGTVQVTLDSVSISGASIPLQSNGGNVSVTNSTFDDGVTALLLNNINSFTITDNLFGGYATAISLSNTGNGISSITGNYFLDVGTGINSLNSDHSQLDILCNEFYSYSAYALKTVNCTLKNQGTATSGAGNKFTNGSLLVNNKFSHNGNTMIYYTDPSSPFTLTTGLGMNATAAAALADGSCVSGARSTQAQNVLEDLSLDLIPNPNAGQVSIIYSLIDNSKKAQILVTNMFGQMVKQFVTETKAQSIDLDCTDLRNGVYFVSLLEDGKVKASRKMIIAK